MLSQTFTDLFHLENNVYCNDNAVMCRLHKLIIIYFKSRNIFNFFLLKKLKESQVYFALMSLLNSENPEQKLRVILGEDPPSPLPCQVEEYEAKLVPQCLGNFELSITYETLDTLSLSENKACIVFLDGMSNVNLVELFRLFCSNKSPNMFAKTELVSKLKHASEMMPAQFVLLLSLNSLKSNLTYLPTNSQHITIHILYQERFKPNYPGLNFTIIYLDEDKHLAEPLLPVVDSNQPHYAVKKLFTFEGFFHN